MSTRSTAAAGSADPTGQRRTPARVAFVGAGPGDPGLMTHRAAELLGRADAVVIDQVAREDVVAAFCGADVEVVDAGHGDHGQPLTHASRAKLVVKTAKAHPGGLVVRLMDGDPSVFNGVGEEAQACVKAGVTFDIVPGVSSVAAVPAYAGIPLTSAGSTAIHVLLPGPGADYSRSVAPDVTAVLLGNPEVLAEGLVGLLDAGRPGDTPVALTERGTTTGQQTRVTTLQGAAKAVAAFHLPTTAVVGEVVDLRSQLSWFETKPLFGWRVLVPRTKDQAGSMVERLSGYGAVSEVVPTISVEPPRSPQQMERAVRGMVTGRYAWVGFTSANAVRAVRERVEAYGLDVRAFAGVKVAAVGGVTAQALRDWGLNPDLVPDGEHSAAGLLEVWPDYDELLDPINRVFLPRADIATDTLVAGLQDTGWEVDDVTAYRTVRAAPPAPEIRDDIKAGRFDAVVFTSSSTVRNLIGIAGKPHSSTVIACIGPATAKTAEELGLRVDVLAGEASAAALVDALADHGQARALAAEEAGEQVRRPSAKRPASRKRASR